MKFTEINSKIDVLIEQSARHIEWKFNEVGNRAIDPFCPFIQLSSCNTV